MPASLWTGCSGLRVLDVCGSLEGVQTETLVHLQPSHAKWAETAICQLLHVCFPDQPIPSGLEETLGFFPEERCHWLLLIQRPQRKRVLCSSPQGISASRVQEGQFDRLDQLDGDRLAGCVCFVDLTSALFIHALAVQPELRRRGLGTRLCVEAQKLSVRRGIARLEGTVDVSGTSAERLRAYYGWLGGHVVESAGFGPQGAADATQLRFRKTLEPGLSEADVDVWLSQLRSGCVWRWLRFLKSTAAECCEQKAAVEFK
ncbi:unnamed protein product, partial [Polarella glacialis]